MQKVSSTTPSVASDTESDSTVVCHDEPNCSEGDAPSVLKDQLVKMLKPDQLVKAAVGDVLKVLLQGATVPPVAVSPALFTVLTDKLSKVLDASERDTALSIDTGAGLARSELVPQMVKLSEEIHRLTAENQRVVTQSEQLAQRLHEAEQHLHNKDNQLRERERQLTEQAEHTSCYRDMSETYQGMYLNAASVATSLATKPLVCAAGRDWLDEAMQVPVVRMPAAPAPPAAVDAESSDQEEEVELVNEKDTVEIMIRNDIRKYGADITSQRWACHRYIFHHLAITDADVFGSAEDGRMHA